jgi:type VI secretion system protein ImpF
MAELTPLERLQPALLDRLCDDEPDKRVESRDKRILNRNQLRAAVLRDLAWLLNSTRPSEREGIGQYPDAARSVINYGLPALAGETASSVDTVELERRVRDAIVEFEPRIDADSLVVEVMLSEDWMHQHNLIGLQIRAKLWAQPVPLDLLLRTEMDLETGWVKVHDLSGAG